MALLFGACAIPAGRFRGAGTYDVPAGEFSIEKPWRSSKRRSKTQSPFSSRKTSRWC